MKFKVYGYLLILCLSLPLTGCINQAALESAVSTQISHETAINLPTVTPTPTSNPIPVTLDIEEAKFLNLINVYRSQNSLPPLVATIILTQASKWMSTDMADHNYFSHTDHLGRSAFTRMNDFGYTQYSSRGENIAAGSGDAQATFNMWKNSPGHNANMLSSTYRAIGIGRAYKANTSYGWYWTTDFGSVVDSSL